MEANKASGLIALRLISGTSLQAAPPCSTVTATDRPALIRVPSSTGYSFPTESGLLLQLSSKGNLKEIRKHAWAVFAGIIQNSIPGDPCSPPIWDTWYVFSHRPQTKRILYLSLFDSMFLWKPSHRSFEMARNPLRHALLKVQCQLTRMRHFCS